MICDLAFNVSPHVGKRFGSFHLEHDEKISALLTCAALAAIERGTEQVTSTVLDDCGYVAPRERRLSSAPAPIYNPTLVPAQTVGGAAGDLAW